MKKKANKALIGVFVLGALALLIAGITVFGTGKIFTRHPTFVMYFKGSVKGLNVGAPVVFRGVKIGEVTDISLQLELDDVSVHIPVLVEINPDSISGPKKKMDPTEYIKLLITQGLRAQLQLQNLITGQLIIELDIHPDKPVNLVGSDTGYPEIPTIPSSLEQFTKTLVQLPLDELMSKLISAIEGVDRAIASPDFKESVHGMNQTLKDLQTLVQNINSQVRPIAKSMDSAVGDARTFVKNFDKQMTKLQTDIDKAVIVARDTLVQAQKTFGAIENVTSGDSSLVYQLGDALEEISSAARSIRALTDYLERHPEALIRGKGAPEGR